MGLHSYLRPCSIFWWWESGTARRKHQGLQSLSSLLPGAPQGSGVQAWASPSSQARWPPGWGSLGTAPIVRRPTEEGKHYHEHTKGPPVGTLRVSPPIHHLGGHVLYRPAE